MPFGVWNGSGRRVVWIDDVLGREVWGAVGAGWRRCGEEACVRARGPALAEGLREE